MSHPRLLIGADWIETGTTFPVIDPYTGAELAQVPLGDEGTIDAAIGAAQAAFATTRKVPAHQRVALLQRVVQGLEKRRAEFVETIISEAGKPVVYAEAEVARAILTFTCAAEEARRWNGAGEVLPLDGMPAGEGHMGLTRRFPIGVISAITPFNFPLNLVAHKVAPCLATGNTMVVKPAPKCPLTALLLAEVLVEAGMPPGQVNFITCGNEHAARLVTDDRVAMVSFTGSPAVGWKLKELAGKKKVCLELGGNAGVVLHSDADLDVAIPMVATGGFAYAGQTCISVQRVFIHDSLYETFKTRFAAYVLERVKAGDPHDRATVIGPMISHEAFVKTKARVAKAVSEGAKFVVGGDCEQVGERAKGSLMPGMVIECINNKNEFSQCELFAPIITLQPYQSIDEVLALLNDSPFGLQAGIFTQDLRFAMRAFETLDVGAVLINQVPTWRVESMPYGGVKDSGFGREGLVYAMEEMSEIKTLVLKLG